MEDNLNLLSGGSREADSNEVPSVFLLSRNIDSLVGDDADFDVVGVVDVADFK